MRRHLTVLPLFNFLMASSSSLWFIIPFFICQITSFAFRFSPFFFYLFLFFHFLWSSFLSLFICLIIFSSFSSSFFLIFFHLFHYIVSVYFVVPPLFLCLCSLYHILCIFFPLFVAFNVFVYTVPISLSVIEGLLEKLLSLLFVKAVSLQSFRKLVSRNILICGTKRCRVGEKLRYTVSIFFWPFRELKKKKKTSSCCPCPPTMYRDW